VMKAAADDPGLYRNLAENTRRPPDVATVAKQYLELFIDQHRRVSDPAA